MSESSDQPDYEWHFKLSNGARDRLHPDALTEMLRQQIKAVLGSVALTGEGANLRVTGFRFLDDPDVEHAIYPELTKRSDAELDETSQAVAAPEEQVC